MIIKSNMNSNSRFSHIEIRCARDMKSAVANVWLAPRVWPPAPVLQRSHVEMSGCNPNLRKIAKKALFVTTMSALVLASGFAHGTPLLPYGATVSSGSVAISAPNASSLLISQSSNKGIINWSTFSIGSGGAVQFNNGSGATLNRVAAGAPISSIDGILSATGSVYLINPNGVIIGKNGQVNVGGTFVASTLDVTDDDFKNGGALTLNGSSGASVVNLGSIGAMGGDVVLIANAVTNRGSIGAPNGDIGLLAGTSILIRDKATDNGQFGVEVVSPGSSASNSGALQAAMIELRTNGGNVYALAGNTAGMINATGVSTDDGKVFLTSGQGHTKVAGVINASQSDGSGGDVITAGKTVGIADANIGAGMWTLQQDAFVLTPTSAAVLSFELAYTAITIKMIGAKGGPSGGDITLPMSLSWSGANSLTLSSHRNIVFEDGAALANTGGASIILAADNAGRGIGTVQLIAGASVSTSGSVTILYNPAGDDKTSVNSFSYTSPTDYSANVSAGSLTSYMLVNTAYDLQNIQNNLLGNYSLGRNIDASDTANWTAEFNPIGGILTPFSGTFEGQGHSIMGLNIKSSNAAVGLFGATSAHSFIENVTLNGGSIEDESGGQVLISLGALVGSNAGRLYNDASSSSVEEDSIFSMSDQTNVGGLVGWNTGTGSIDLSSFSGSTLANGYLGQLVGANAGVISRSFARRRREKLLEKPHGWIRS